jgi:hypothetical protein
VSERGGADGGRERVVDDCGALNATGAGLIGSAHLSSRSRLISNVEARRSRWPPKT